MSSQAPKLGQAHKVPAHWAIQAQCPSCRVVFAAPLAAKSTEAKETEAQIAESARLADLSAKVREYVKGCFVNKDDAPACFAAYAGLLDLLRAEGVWSP